MKQLDVFKTAKKNNNNNNNGIPDNDGGSLLFEVQNSIREIEKIQLIMLMIKQEQELNYLEDSNFLGYLRQLEKQMQQNLNINYSSNGSDSSFLTTQNQNIKTIGSQNTLKSQNTKKGTKSKKK